MLSKISLRIIRPYNLSHTWILKTKQQQKHAKRYREQFGGWQRYGRRVGETGERGPKVKKEKLINKYVALLINNNNKKTKQRES